MYHRAVRSKVHAVFSRLNSGDATLMLSSLAPAFEYRFLGEHALAGRRTELRTMRQWWDRLFRLLPGARFVIDDILVNGPPWHTRVALSAHVSGVLPNGQRYENRMMQRMLLRWGRVVSIETLENLQLLERALWVVAAAGNSEAIAPPLEDGPPLAADSATLSAGTAARSAGSSARSAPLGARRQPPGAP